MPVNVAAEQQVGAASDNFEDVQCQVVLVFGCRFYKLLPGGAFALTQ